MDNDDIVRPEDVAEVRARVLKVRRRVLGAATVTPIVAAIFVGLLAYHFKFHNIAVSTFISSIFLLLGVPVFLHWWRHYRSILGQLDLVAQRIASGETVYGSKVAFHSYR